MEAISLFKNVNKHHKTSLSRSQRFASWITGRIGTITFFYIIFSWTAIWLLWNLMAPKSMQFDPAPDFLMWLFLSNMVQIFLMPLIMISQNLQGKHAEILADNDFEVNKQAEQEIKELRQKLDYLTDLIEKRLPSVN